MTGGKWRRSRRKSRRREIRKIRRKGQVEGERMKSEMVGRRTIKRRRRKILRRFSKFDRQI